MRDFQEIQYLAWWVGLGLLVIGILIPILILAAIPPFVRHGFTISLRGSRRGWSPRDGRSAAEMNLSSLSAAYVVRPDTVEPTHLGPG